MGRSFLMCVLAAVLALAAIAACQSVTPTPSPSPTPEPTATPSPTPSSSPTPIPSPTVTVDPNATPTLLPTGGPGAFMAVKAYEDYLLSGSYTKAWALLAKNSQAQWGSLAKFQTERAKFLETAGTEYEEELSPTNTLTLPQWMEGRGWTAVNVEKAFLVSVHWTGVPDPYAGWEIWVVNPTKTGWLLYRAH